MSLRHQLVLKKLGLAWQAVRFEPTRVSPLLGTRCQPTPSKNTEADLSLVFLGELAYSRTSCNSNKDPRLKEFFPCSRDGLLGLRLAAITPNKQDQHQKK